MPLSSKPTPRKTEELRSSARTADSPSEDTNWFVEVDWIEEEWESLAPPSRSLQGPLVALGMLALLGAVLWLWQDKAHFYDLSAMSGESSFDPKDRLSKPSDRYDSPQNTRLWAASLSETANYSGDALPLDAPKPGDWLYNFPEAGQTFEQYKAKDHTRRDDQRHTIYVAPLGETKARSERIIQVMAEYLDAYYDTRTRVLPPIPLPLGAYQDQRKQYDARAVLDALQMHVPDDAIGLVTVTEADLYIPSARYVFGLGSHHHKTATISLNRLGDDFRIAGKPGTVLRRALLTASHEFGHILSMKHCTAFQCLMNGTNSLEEVDRHQLHICPECHRKARAAMGFHQEDRYARLLDFYERYNFPRAASFVERRLNPPTVEFLTEEEFVVEKEEETEGSERGHAHAGEGPCEGHP